MLVMTEKNSVLAQARSIDDAHEYRACLVLTRMRPDEAFESALAWRDQGGGIAARHCAALALIELKQFAEAAQRLELVADDMRRAGHPLLPEMLGQAGNAWLLAGRNERAHGALSAALALMPEDADLLVDRARASAAADNWADAARDLDLALAVDPARDEAYAFRASARRNLGDLAGALEDAETALAVNAEAIEALLERGILRRLRGDLAGARADWLKIRLDAPGTPAAEAALVNIEKLELKAE
jgi:tetratricopeptide (TPR) repeat protein